MKAEESIKQDKCENELAKVVVNVLFTSAWLSAKLNTVLKPYKISLQQYNVLRILKGQYPCPAMLGMIQERMIDKMSNATRLVDKLMDKGLVSRGQCQSNRRQVDILITEKGLDLLKQMEKQVLKVDQDLAVSPEEAIALNRLLEKLRT
jgi:DNA-binding MarR family transcriptional regulator